MRHHFAYPQDIQLCKIYKEVVNDYKNELTKKSKEEYDQERLGPAWRWLLIREADLEQ